MHTLASLQAAFSQNNLEVRWGTINTAYKHKP